MSGTDSASAHGSEEPDAEDQAGILGNLPRSRPSVRSPRRVAQPEARAEAAESAAEQSSGGGGREAEVEALARAGISLAGSAATLGLRAAGRAAAALRDAVERR